MKLCITEKPSVARDIARILHADKRCDGYFEGHNICVTWTFGHLCCLKEPHDYSPMWKHWSLAALPMIPPKFGIKIINDKGVKKQFGVIKDLIGKADEVINCGDAGQEGELIQRWVMQKAGIKCPVRRLWISSLTDDAIREGFKNLQPEQDYKNLYEAGLSRAIGDWLLGLNATRLYSLKYGVGGSVLSIGRVQTPTLALIVERHHQISNFVPEEYWELRTIYRDVTFNARTEKFKQKEKAQQLLSEISGNDLTVTDVKEKKGRESAPRLFDLTSLQVECNKQWGWSAEETLKLIQALYEKKVTTYPRVDTTYLPEDMYKHVPDILKKMTPYAFLTDKILGGKIPKSKKVFDNAKITDHHAIIPTGELPNKLIGDEKKLYHLIARRFIAVFYPDCVFNTTTVLAKVDKVEFKTTGKVIEKPGWREIYADNKDSSKNAKSLETVSASGKDMYKEETEEAKDPEKVLPKFEIGESGPHRPEIVSKTTQPPKPYTEGTLLRAMEGAGKTVEEEELREAMKENGIGRPSTRAAIIETLFKRRYIKRERKSIQPTQAGIDLIATIHTEILKSAKLTGLWENKLRRIERGAYAAADFINEIKLLLGEIVTSVMTDMSATRIVANEPEKKKKKTKRHVKKTNKTQSKTDAKKTSGKTIEFADIVCPNCGKGHLLKGRKAIGCSEYKQGCKFLIPFEKFGSNVTADTVTVQHVKKYMDRG